MMPMKIRILIVDDEPDLLEVLADNLSGDGFDVLFAENAEEFRRHALKSTPHIIILDIALGADNGPEIGRAHV